MTSLILASTSLNAANGKVIHKERSLYRTVMVVQDSKRLCMQFSVRRDQRNQSCKDRRDPKRLVFDYAKLVFSGFLLTPNPKSILVVGLGGGTLPVAFRELLPNAHIDVVEIDPAVASVAEAFFDYKASAPGKLYVQDARIFGKRAATRPQRYDLILLDAFNGDYIPEHLMTREYLLETQKLLAPDGVLLANTFSISKLYHHESTTYESVFGKLLTVQTPQSANRVIVAKNGRLPDDEEIDRNAQLWARKLEPYDVNLRKIQAQLSDKGDWDTSARVLTDQYSPANLLQN
jgi:spermidine synthase